MATSFELLWQREDRWGRLAAVALPEDPLAVPGSVRQRLAPEEAAFLDTLRGYRPAQFAGGRLALRAAAEAQRLRLPAVLPDERGAPRLPDGLVGSISHKRELAVAVVQRDQGWKIGLDFEPWGRARPEIVRLVLRPEELPAGQGELPWRELLTRFSLKEALYKALDPYVRRYVGFREVAMWPREDGSARVELHLEGGEGPFEVEARVLPSDDWALAMVRVRTQS